MNDFHSPANRARILQPASALALFLLLVLAPAGCADKSSHTSNPQLRDIDKMLNAQLSKGASRSRVSMFLNSRGYRQQDSTNTTLVAIVRHVNTETLQPSTARVTFHFDANDNLVSYDLETAPDLPLQP